MKKIGAFLKKRHYLGLKILIIAILICICVLGTISYFKGNVLPVVLTLSEATVKAMAVNAINSASHMVLDSEMTYEDFVSITKDADGNIQLIQANTVKINRLTRDLANLAQSNIEKIEESCVTLPLGAFTGSLILANYGPDVDIALLPVGSVLCDFGSVFEEVGINQTRHSIYININTVISLVLPVSSVPVSITTSVLVCDNIIVGKVPDVYLDSNGKGGKFDLIPSK